MIHGGRALRRCAPSISVSLLFALAIACGPSLPPPRAEAIPAGKGWFCYELLGLTTCSRDLEECERGRRLSPGSCSLRETAWCFTSRQSKGDGPYVGCAGSDGDCTRIRGNLVELGDVRDESACAEER